jgi:hypothetical protein
VGTKEKPKDGMDNMFVARYRPTGFDHKYDLVSSPFNKIWPRNQIFLPCRTGTILPLPTDMFQPDDGMGVLIRSKSAQEPYSPG